MRQLLDVSESEWFRAISTDRVASSFFTCGSPFCNEKAVRLVERSQGTADGGVGVEQPQKLLHNNVNDKARSARPTVPVARSKPASDSVRFSPSARAQETRRCANVQLTAHEAVDHNRVTDSTLESRTQQSAHDAAWPRHSLPQIERDAIHGRCLLRGEDRPAQRFGDVRQGTSSLREHLQPAQIAFGPAALRRTQRHTQPRCFFLCRIQAAVQRARDSSSRHLLLRKRREAAYLLLRPGALFRPFWSRHDRPPFHQRFQ